MTVKTQEWSSSMVGGGVPASLAHAAGHGVFSHDGKYFLAKLAHEIRVYFVATRQCVRTIEAGADCVDFKLDADGARVLVFGAGGAVTAVNWKDRSTAAESVDLDVLAVIKVCASHFYLVAGALDRAGAVRVVAFDRRARTSRELFQLPAVAQFAVSPNAQKLAFLTVSHQVVVADLAHYYAHDHAADIAAPLETLSFSFKSQIVSLAVSNSAVVALGSVSGPIQVLFGGLADAAPQKLLKWHIGPVRALQFSADGDYLLSGGLEKVLVFWHLDTDKTQFLPRLNGSIEKIALDPHRPDYYQAMLRISGSDADELLVVSAVDLVSRLSVNAVRPNYANAVGPTLAKVQKRYAKAADKFDLTKLKHDYCSSFEVNPKTNHLYFPNQSHIQAWDLLRNEQVFLQNIAPVVATGKVKSETKLLDPTVTQLKFSHDGEWMCTFDVDETSEVDGLLSADDKKFALKFWKYVEPAAKDASANSIKHSEGYWELTTKIIDPHGNSQPVLSITAAPAAVNSGLAFLTADARGNLRVWKPRIPKDLYSKARGLTGKPQQTAWSVTRTRNLDLAETKSVDTCWSEDGSVVLLAHENNIKVFSGNNLALVDNDKLNISDSNIRSIDLIGTDLIVLSKTRISSFNLLTNRLNELVAKVNTTHGSKALISVDPARKLVCLALNYYVADDDKVHLRSKIAVFRPDQLQPVATFTHHDAISAVSTYNSSFLFVDVNARIGLINRKDEQLVKEDSEAEIVKDIELMLNNAQATSNLMNSQPAEAVNEVEASKTISLNSFQTLFENTDNIPLENLFDNIIKIIR